MKPLDQVQVRVTDSTGAFIHTMPRYVHLTVYGERFQGSVTLPLKAGYELFHKLGAALLEADIDKAASTRDAESRYWESRSALPSGSFVGD